MYSGKITSGMATSSTFVPSASEEEYKDKQKQFLSVPENLDAFVNNIYESLLEEAMLEIVYDVHNPIKLEKFGLLEMREEEKKNFPIAESKDADIFGTPAYGKKTQVCYCPSCNRPLSASRFAPHLEKCLGMGRNSSRIASLRIANNSKDNAYSAVSDDDDIDWVGGQEKTKFNKKPDGKRRRDKNLTKKNKVSKGIGEKHKEDGHTIKIDDIEAKLKLHALRLM